MSREEAEHRAALISDVHYVLHFALDGAKPDFTGQVEAAFELRQAVAPGQALTIDFDGGKIASLSVNERRLDGAAADYNGKFISLPGDALKVGSNKVTIAFSHPYSTTGKGLYRFKDPEDGKLYLYTDFEPYDANRLFPCFDQPDLKATYQLSVDAPSSWTVVSSNRETSHSTLSDGGHWVFPVTKPFSTYLFSLHAGEYRVWEDRAGAIPLRLFARQSLAKYVDANEWFTYTKQGLGFYQSYFDYPYPFGKLDQVIVPDFNAGAMENVAAITYSERYFKRGTSTRADREHRAGVLLHEMAHQWFGDLVTMRWWNDLWLNESFATFMSTLAMADATEFKDVAWIDFTGGNKAYAYQEDQYVTTHPIEGVVLDSEQAFASFDSITYGKGASVLKQLSFYLGPDTFRNGVRLYFKEHEYANATLHDFMKSMGEASKDEDEWAGQWLQTAGVNTVEASFACDGGKIASFALLQSAPPDHATLRAHRSKIGLYDRQKDGKVVLRRTVSATYQGASTPVAELVGEACPALVFPNYEDYDYVKVKLDPASLAFVKTSLDQIPSPHLRLMLWNALWSMVRDTSWPVTAYLDLLVRQAPREPEIPTLERTLATVGPAIYFLPAASSFRSQRAATLKKLGDVFWQRAKAAPAGSDLQKLWYDAYVNLGEYPEAHVALAALLSGKAKLKGMDLDQDRRWTLIQRLSAVGDKQASELRRAELRRDGSARGQLASIEAEAALPDRAVKDKVYGEIVDRHAKRPLAETKAAIRGLFPLSQASFRGAFAQRYYTDVVAMADRDREWLSAFAGWLIPATCTDASAAALKGFVDAHSQLPPYVVKRLKIAQQEDDLCTRVRALALPQGPAGKAHTGE